ncbi:hypothetical protein [Streptomyces sp. CCM_MD2014]|uniref:hypothetical protein n=1 Tax=Streptomyces sp. CCM_MD2014 TaxID=1561022 RepID=UPI00099D87E2|nr:hypothetical protein [Streptomyces sp. CCM_MD2014]
MSSQPESSQPEPDSRLLRLLPWGEEGKRAYLLTDSSGTWLSRLADRAEAEQIETANMILSLTKPLVEDETKHSVPELRWAARRLIAALTDVLTVAESRGHRIHDYRAETDDGQSSDGPTDDDPSSDGH